MKIANVDISQRVLVIAEIGVNHDGHLWRAFELVQRAKAAGADAVKLQVFRAATLVHKSAQFAEYQKTRVDAADPAEMLRQYELSDAELQLIAEAAAEAGMAMISTPFSPADVPRAAAISSAIKIASPDLVNRRLLLDVIDTGLPVIVSTGAAQPDEISRTVAWLKAKHANFTLLHCISSYPVNEADANLCWIGDLAKHGVPVGYSDHTTDVLAGALAVAAGARIVEKHLTHDTAAPGPDHSASFDPPTFTKYVRLLRQAERMVGTPGRRVLACENDVRTVSRQSLVAMHDILAGQRIGRDDLTTQRPGTGLSAERFEDVLGQPATRTIRAGEMLSPQDVADAG